MMHETPRIPRKKTKEMQKEDAGVLSKDQQKIRAKRLATVRKNRADDAKARQKENDKEKQMTQKERLIPDKKLKNLKVSDVDSKKNVGDTRSRALSRRMKKRGTSLQAQAEEITGVGSIPNPAQTAMGPSGLGKVQYMHDRRRRAKERSVMLKRFRDYLQDKGIV